MPPNAIGRMAAKVAKRPCFVIKAFDLGSRPVGVEKRSENALFDTSSVRSVQISPTGLTSDGAGWSAIVSWRSGLPHPLGLDPHSARHPTIESSLTPARRLECERTKYLRHPMLIVFVFALLNILEGIAGMLAAISPRVS